MSLRFALFYHSLVSDWNHGNAHFLRGIALELLARGHAVSVYEPENNWSRENLLRDRGPQAIERFTAAFPDLRSSEYRLSDLDLHRVLDGVDVALVHEWNDPALVAAIGQYRRNHPHIRALFHDTHHRAITAPAEIGRFDLANYDAVLAYGASLRDAYQRLGWGRQVHVWHEAADIRTFYPRSRTHERGDVIWVGNWGDEERTEGLREFLIGPVGSLRLRAQVNGVRYPQSAVSALARAGIEYGGWIPNFEVPGLFAQFRVTVHVPRGPYAQKLSGIPTIRPFEALACGIPMISAPWSDSEGLFRPGSDFLMVHTGAAMRARLRDVLHDPDLAQSLARNGLETVRNRHTCAHRVSGLFQILESHLPARTQARFPVEVSA